MSAVPLGVSAYRLSLGRTPEVRLENMYIAKDPTNLVDGLQRIQRPGLEAFATLSGNSGVQGMFKQEGAFGGDIIVVSGGDRKVDRVADTGSVAFLGTINGTGRVQITAGGVTGTAKGLIATGDDCWSTDGASVTQIVMPGDEMVYSVAYISGYFLLSQTGTQRVYWLAQGETNPDALSFFSAEVTTDEIICLMVIVDQVWIFGQSSIEVWQPTGDGDIPFVRVQGRLYDKGTLSRDTVVKADNSLFWVGADSIVYRADTVPIAISDEALTEKIQAALPEDLRAYRYALGGHEFYALRVGNQGMYVYDITSKTWSKFTSHETENGWRAHLGVQTNTQVVVAGDELSPRLWRLVEGRSNDNGEPIVRRLTGTVALLGNPTDCNSFSLCSDVGQIVGPGEPFAELNWSDDQGQTWGPNWRRLYMGKQGEYAHQVTTWALGDIKAPGRTFDVRYSHDSVWRVSYARINEAQP